MDEIGHEIQEVFRGKNQLGMWGEGPAGMILRFPASPWVKVNRDRPHEECVHGDEPSAARAGFEGHGSSGGRAGAAGTHSSTEVWAGGGLPHPCVTWHMAAPESHGARPACGAICDSPNHGHRPGTVECGRQPGKTAKDQILENENSQVSEGKQSVVRETGKEPPERGGGGSQHCPKC